MNEKQRGAKWSGKAVSSAEKKKKKGLHDIVRLINPLVIERHLRMRLLLHIVKIRPPCLDLSGCNSGRIRKRRSTASILVQSVVSRYSWCIAQFYTLFF